MISLLAMKVLWGKIVAGWTAFWAGSWRWVVAGAAVAGGFFLYFWARRTGADKTPTQPVDPGIGPAVEKVTKDRVDEILRDAEQAKQETVQDASQERARLEAEVVRDTEQVRTSVEATNAELLEIGREQRGP